MYGKDTFAIDVSSNSMNVARVTVSAMNHGFTAGLPVDIVPPESANIDGRLERHSGPQQVLRILIFIEPNPHGESLHYLHVIPGRVFRREKAEQRTGSARQTLHFALVVASEGIHSNGDRL